jgi:hypothetical protein
MSQFTEILSISREAAADLSAKQFYAGKLDSTGKVALSGANDKAALGIIGNKPAAGETAELVIGGTTRAIVSEAVAVGDRLTPTAAGKLEVVDLADEAYIARALEPATADGDIIEVLIERGEANTSDA